MTDDMADVVIEDENEEQSGRSPEEALARIRAKLRACEADKKEYMDGWQRAKADYVNLLKRSGEDAKASERKGTLKAVETLLPAFDALERAKEHGEVPEGFFAIAKQLEGAFAGLGLVEVGQVGETFDPALHEAFGQDKVEDAAKDGTITAVLEKGWKVGVQVIRPAKVRVAMA